MDDPAAPEKPAAVIGDTWREGHGCLALIQRNLQFSGITTVILPVRAEDIENHVMHEEWYTVPPRTAEAVLKAKSEGRKVVAVGTTSLRTLESAARGDGTLTSGPGSTRIFIHPGYGFKVVDALFTNFHTPKSTLLMLVSAFAGRELILSTYAEAVSRGYRFFSYGDAMFIR